MADNKKYLYIFSNSERADLIKIGRTDKHPVLRAEQLSRQTGTLGKYTVEWSLEVPDSEMAEKLIHYKMKQYHYDKEFFKTDAKTAITIIEETLFPFFNIKQNNEDDNLSEEKAEKIINALKIALKFTSTDKQKEDILKQIHEYEAKLFRHKLKPK